MSYQNVTIVGNVGRDAELKYLQSGIAVLKFSVGVNKTIGKGEDRRQTTTWFNVTVWRERAEVLYEYIRKGMQVLVTGEIGLSPYIGKDGKANASLELTADDVKLLTSKQEMERRAAGEYDAEPAADEEEAQPEPPKAKAAATNGKGQPPKGKVRQQAQGDEDIPF
jgi:single-strand DNA-binding protein